MTIGVVIPSYNRADLLPVTLDAVRAQTRSPDQVIVVDDGSTDETQAVLARQAAGMTLQVLTVVNGGDLAARNVGVRACTADLVAFCDSDDLWTADHLQRLEALFAACPAMIAAYADFRVVRGGAWLDGTKFEQAPDSFWEGLDEVADVAGGGVFHGPVVARLLSYQPFFPSAMMVRRAEFLAVGGWDEAPGRTLGGDFATALLMAEQPALGVLRRPTVGIRKHRENRSGDVQHMNLGDSLVLEQVLRNRPSLAPYRDAIQASVVQRRLDALHSAFARADYDGVREIAAMIPAAHRSGAVMAKSAVASLPRPARDLTARVLRAAGNVRMRLGGVLR